MKPERYVLIWSVWSRVADKRWHGRELHVPLIKKFNPFEPVDAAPNPEFLELVFRRHAVGGFQVVECEGVIVHDARVVA